MSEKISSSSARCRTSQIDFAILHSILLFNITSPIAGFCLGSVGINSPDPLAFSVILTFWQGGDPMKLFKLGRVITSLVTALVLISVYMPSVLAQTSSTGVITGVVKDQSGGGWR